MKLFHLLFFVCFCSTQINAQIIKGEVFQIINNKKKPVEMATVQQTNTSNGTFTDENGVFELKIDTSISKEISISHPEFNVIKIFYSSIFQHIQMTKNIDLDEVEIKQQQSGTKVSTLSTQNVEIITIKELKRAACCNLGESFETNGTTDVTQSDAVTGTRQISMLGLASPYVHFLHENISSLKFMNGYYGLNYIPGPWVSEICISKGIGTVTNGYEGLAGAINYEWQKPLCGSKAMINIYGNTNARLEANIYLPYELNENLTIGGFWHSSTLNKKHDTNNDGFMDMPAYTQHNGAFRWSYMNEFFEFQGGFQALFDNKNAGNNIHTSEHVHTPFEIGIKNNAQNAWVKTSLLGAKNENNSTGLQLSYNGFQSDLLYGLRWIESEDNRIYANLIHHHQLKGDTHSINIGSDIMYFKRNLKSFVADGTFIIAEHGIYGEYSYKPNDKFNVVLGFRGDWLNSAWQLTPRLHAKYNINENNIIRFNIGKGMHRADVLSENLGLLSLQRNWKLQNFFPVDLGWNTGLNFTRKHKLFKQDGSFKADAFYTHFTKKNLVDFYLNSQSISFYSKNNSANSLAIQVEMQQFVTKNFDVRITARYENAIEEFLTTTKQRVLYAPFKTLATVAFASDNKKWNIDVTATFYSRKLLIPENNFDENNILITSQTYSPSYIQLNAQAMYTHKNIEIYGGVENSTNVLQSNMINTPETPYSSTFNASNIWGNVNGIMPYLGLKYYFTIQKNQ